MAASIWKGALTFGLLSIPIRLYAAARSERTQLHQLHAKCHTRLRQPLYCPTCDRIVKRDEVVKGFEYEKGHYVVVDKEDLKKITPDSGRSMEILAFVKGEEIDPIFFDSSYVALPDKDADKLPIASKGAGRNAACRNREIHNAPAGLHSVVRPRDGGITVHTMYFFNEIRQVPGYGENPKNLQLRPQELKLAEQLIESLSQDFNPAQYHDTYQDQLRALVEAKQKGKAVVEKPVPKHAKVIDMMEALKRSVQEAERGPRRMPGPTAVPTRRHARRAS